MIHSVTGIVADSSARAVARAATAHLSVEKTRDNGTVQLSWMIWCTRSTQSDATFNKLTSTTCRCHWFQLVATILSRLICLSVVAERASFRLWPTFLAKCLLLLLCSCADSSMVNFEFIPKRRSRMRILRILKILENYEFLRIKKMNALPIRLILHRIRSRHRRSQYFVWGCTFSYQKTVDDLF